MEAIIISQGYLVHHSAVKQDRWNGLSFFEKWLNEMWGLESMILAYLAALSAWVYALQRVQISLSAFRMCVYIATGLTARSTRNRASPVASVLQSFSAHRLVWLSASSLQDKHSIQPAAMKTPRSSSSMEALYDVGTESSFSCLLFFASYFSYDFCTRLNSMKCSVNGPFKHETPIQQIIVSLTGSFLASASTLG